MLNAAVAALACLCLARTSPAEPYGLRLYSQNIHIPKDISSILANIEERLRVLDTVSAVQEKQSRRLDAIQDKLDRVETTFTLKLERAQLAAERLEHRLHMMQTNVQASIKESSDKIERSQRKITELALNLTYQINEHKTLLEKVNGAYADTWHRGLVLEGAVRDGFSLVNVTRRELADGLKALTRRHRDAMSKSSADLEAKFAGHLYEKTFQIQQKIQDVVDAQKRFVESCQRVQQDDPNQVTNMIETIITSLISKISFIYRELQTIQAVVRDHDNSVMKFISTARAKPQIDTTCHQLENSFRNRSNMIFKETELKQLIEKFVALTDRADAALQRLEMQINNDDDDDEQIPSSENTDEYNKLLIKLEPKDTDEKYTWDDDDDKGYYEDGGGGQIVHEDHLDLKYTRRDKRAERHSARPAHRRHLHKHPYDRGPKLKPSIS